MSNIFGVTWPVFTRACASKTRASEPRKGPGCYIVGSKYYQNEAKGVTNQGAIKHGRGNGNDAPDLCVMRGHPRRFSNINGNSHSNINCSWKERDGKSLNIKKHGLVETHLQMNTKTI
jgi:hypothetical protein